MHGGNVSSNVSVRSPNAKDVDTNDNLNTGDDIANSENDVGLDFEILDYRAMLVVMTVRTVLKIPFEKAAPCPSAFPAPLVLSQK